VVDTNKPLRILHLEDNASDAKLCMWALRQAHLEFTVDVVATEMQFKEKIHAHTYDVHLVDFRLPCWTGLDAIRWLRSIGNRTPSIIVTGTLEVELVLECIKAGAVDCLYKGNLEFLPRCIQRAVDEQMLRDAHDRAVVELRESERQCRSIIDNAPYGICRVDGDGIIVMANPAMVGMLNNETDAGTQESQRLYSLFGDPVERRRVFREFESPSSSTRPELIWQRRDGKQIVFRLAGRRLPASHVGEIVYEVFVEDITEGWALEQQLRQTLDAIAQLGGDVAHDLSKALLALINKKAE